MKFKAKFGPTLEQMHSALVSGFQGITLTNGKTLTATNTTNTTPSGGVYPFLAFRTGKFKLTPWKDYQYNISWDIPATLTVQGPGEDGEITARGVINDLILRTMMLIGLPVDAKGNVVPMSDKTLKMYDDGKLSFLCERGAPFLTSGDVTGVDDGLCRAELVFHIESTMCFDQRELNLMKIGVLGLNPVPPDGLFQDTTATDGRGIRMVFGTADETAFGGYNTQDPNLSGLNPIPPLSQVPNAQVQGLRPSEVITRIDVHPFAASISSGSPTSQLSAIAFYQDSHSTYVTSSAAWTSSDPTVASVNTAGLVTRVASGSCTINCLFGGVTSNSVAITSA